MKILFLGPPESSLPSALENLGDTLVRIDGPLTPATVEAGRFDFLVCFGYRHILKKDVLEFFENKAVNLHISLLPWNRGADPNFWSFLKGTPKGVTIHHLDEGIDTGDLIVQKEIVFSGQETLKSSYARLHSEIQQLFLENWSAIRAGTSPRTPQPAGGSVHRAKDKEPWLHLLTQGWDTPVSVLADSGKLE